jgi:hypothetical protein
MLGYKGFCLFHFFLISTLSFSFLLPFLLNNAGFFFSLVGLIVSRDFSFVTFHFIQLLLRSSILPLFFDFSIFFVAMVLIKECDEMGRDIAPITFEEEFRLWRDSMRHAKRPNGSISWVVFEQEYFGHSLLGGSSSSSDSESDDFDSSDSDCVFLYSTPGPLHKREICLYSPQYRSVEGIFYILCHQVNRRWKRFLRKFFGQYLFILTRSISIFLK